MSIQELIRVSPQLQPNRPSSHGQSSTNGGGSDLAKKVLENNGSISSSTPFLQASKFTKTEHEQRISLKNDFIPPALVVRIERQVFEQISAAIAQSKLKTKEIQEEITLNKNGKHRLNEEILHRANYVAKILAKAKFFQAKKQESDELKCIEFAHSQVIETAKLNYFNTDTHYAAYLFKGYNGITCLDMNIIRENLLILRRAIALNIEGQALSKELEKAATFFKTRWKELQEEGQLNEETYRLLNKQLEQVLSEDPFKDEFIKNPELFKKIGNAPDVLLKKFPHLKSVNDFLSKYPEAGIICLRNQTYNLQNLKQTLSDAESNPLARSIHLLAEEPVITSTAAKLIRDFMLKHPKVKICLGDEADGTELAKSFFEDVTLTQNRGALVSSKGIVIGQNRPVYSYMIDPQNPFVRKKPEPVLAPVQNTTGLVDGHTFFILTRESGKKALAVKECEVDSVKKIKNRSYVDENGVTQEYDIVVFGPEFYGKLDKITGNIHQKYS